jgi:hypothetical protein
MAQPSGAFTASANRDDGVSATGALAAAATGTPAGSARA